VFASTSLAAPDLLHGIGQCVAVLHETPAQRAETCIATTGHVVSRRVTHYTGMADDSTGAMIRTLLANERTFLAWLRTGLTMVALGAGASQLLDPHRLHGVPLNAVLAIMLAGFGGLFVLVGLYRYRRTEAAIRQDQLGRRGTSLYFVVAATLIVLVVALIVIVQSGS
jgi:putative membrane protein